MSWDSDIVCHTCKVRRSFASHKFSGVRVENLEEFYSKHVYDNHDVALVNFNVADNKKLDRILETYRDEEDGPNADT